MAVIFWGDRSLPPGRAAVLFPLLGAGLGAAGAGIFLGAGYAAPTWLAALLTVAFWTGTSGVLRENAQVGIWGAIAIVISVLARWQALAHLASPRVLEICIMAQAVPRAAVVALAWVSRPAGPGLLKFSSTLTTPVALAALVQGTTAAFLVGVRAGVIVIAGAYLIMRLAQWYFYRRIGGIDWNCLGATEQILEIFLLVVFVRLST